jgi:hypothetical protein
VRRHDGATAAGTVRLTPRTHRSPLLHVVPLLLLGLVLVAGSVLGHAGTARADDDGGSGQNAAGGGPVRLVLATSGLTWDDIDPERTPQLHCLARASGLGAMNTTSATVVSMTDQGMESLHTGHRGLAARAPASAGIPNPPTDQLAGLPHGVDTIHVGRTLATDDATTIAQVAEGARSPSVLIVDVGPVLDPATDPEIVDERVGVVLAAAGVDSGHCAEGTGSLPRTLRLSVAASDPADPTADAAERSVASRSAGLQVAMDTGFPGDGLSSGSTHQDGLVVLTDVLPTILDSHHTAPTRILPGQPFTGRGVHGVSDTPRQLVQDRSEAALLVDRATLPALGSWLALGLIGLAILFIGPPARRPRLHALAQVLLAITPLALPVGLCASAVPWWRGDRPTLALTGLVWIGSTILSVIVLAGPWRRWRHGPTGISAALVVVVILVESAVGSPFQTGSPLGAQPISGGRFYGLSNHLFGMVLAATMIALACLFTNLTDARTRIWVTIGVGAVIAGMCVAPQMGADFGSMLVTVPTFGLLALLVSGRRTRVRHVLILLTGGIFAVLAVSILDWRRPPAARSHLGRFVDEVLSGNLVTIMVRKLTQNLTMVLDFPGLGLVLAAAVVASIAVAVPARLRWQAMARLQTRYPSVRAALLMLVAGTWLGYVVDDTGTVLAAAALGLAIPWTATMLSWPGPERSGLAERAGMDLPAVPPRACVDLQET